MLVIGFALLAVVVLAGLVTAYVAFPHRGEDIPRAQWLSDAMVRSNQRVTDKLADVDERLQQRRRSR
jgi:hypothetical protein